MAYYERSYYHEEGGHGSQRVVYWLLGINVVIWLLDQILTGSARGSAVSPFEWLNFNVHEGVYGGQIWRLATYQFVHSTSDFLHIFFNMMILLFLGPLMEQWWGSRKFLAFYLLCGTCGSVVYTLLSFIPQLLGVNEYVQLVGASGSIYGIILGSAMIYPDRMIRMLWLPFEFRLKMFCYIILGIAVAKIAAGSANAGGEAAHLGGMLPAWLLIRRPGWLNFAEAGFWGMFSPARLREKMHQKAEVRRQARQAAQEKEIDRILDKVHREGLASLTSREKRTLQEATAQQRDR